MPVMRNMLCNISCNYHMSEISRYKRRRQNSYPLAAAKMLQHPTAMYGFSNISLLQPTAEYVGLDFDVSPLKCPLQTGYVMHVIRH